MDFCQILPVGVLRRDSVLEIGVDCREELGLECLADSTGTGVGGDYRIGGVVLAEGSQEELAAEHG